MICELCNSPKVVIYHQLNKDGIVYQRYRCRHCGYDDYAD